jgi:hypothetical protein
MSSTVIGFTFTLRAAKSGSALTAVNAMSARYVHKIGITQAVKHLLDLGHREYFSSVVALHCPRVNGANPMRRRCGRAAGSARTSRARLASTNAIARRSRCSTARRGRRPLIATGHTVTTTRVMSQVETGIL